MNEVNVPAEERNKPAVCRICLTSCEGKTLSIFEKLKDLCITTHISLIANVRIVEGDGLPSDICSTCLLQLNNAIDFKEKCEASDLLLRNGEIPYPYKIEIDFPLIKEEKESDGFEEGFEYQNVDNVDENSGSDDVKIKKDSRTKSFPCSQCNKVLKSACKLRVHIKRDHNSQFKCENCKRIFKSNAAFDRHINTEAGQLKCFKFGNNPLLRIEGEGKNRKFFCRKCDYSSNVVQYMEQHIVRHTGDKPYQCDLCSSAYTQRGSLITHKQLMHNSSSGFQCGKCGKEFKARAFLLKHESIVHAEPRFGCDICKASFKRKYAVILHMARHEGVKRYTCEICAKNFFTVSELCNHKRFTHGTERKPRGKSKCEICGYQVWDNSQLMRHMKKHQGDKQHSCSICGRFFGTMQNFEKHMKKHEGAKKCPYCPSTYIDLPRLSLHIMTKHKEDLPKKFSMEFKPDVRF